MTIEQIVAFLVSSGPYLLIKIFAIISVLLHLAFSLCIVRQTKLMITMIEARVSSVIYLVAVIHLLYSIFVLIWAIFIL